MDIKKFINIIGNMSSTEEGVTRLPFTVESINALCV